MNGKGDTPRPVNWAKYGDNWDAIFRKKKAVKQNSSKQQNRVTLRKTK